MPVSNNASTDKISLSADIVSAYVSRNSVTPGGLPALMSRFTRLSQVLVLWRLFPKLRFSCQQCQFENPSHRAF